MNDLFPVGTLLVLQDPLPVGWLRCDGAFYSRSEHWSLFKVIGYAYGHDSEERFAVPDDLDGASPVMPNRKMIRSA